MMITFTVQGTPKAQPRPRACIRGQHAGVFNPPDADAWKRAIGFALRESIITPDGRARWTRTDKPIVLSVWFSIPRPKSHFYASKKRAGQLREGAPTFCASKPDIDNYAKAVMDAITNTQLIWHDDAQVIMLQATKMYCSPLELADAQIQIKTTEELG